MLAGATNRSLSSLAFERYELSSGIEKNFLIIRSCLMSLQVHDEVQLAPDVMMMNPPIPK